MSFGREKRLLLGALAALAALPLPFNQVVSWGAMAIYWLAIVLFLWRVDRDVGSPLPAWAMNLLGIVYLPVLFIDFFVFWQGRLLRPLVQLALFALAVKLFGMKLEKDKWHIVLLTFFTFVAAMGSSVHPAMVFYLMAFVAASVLVLARFATFHVLSSYGVRGEVVRPVPLRGFVITATLLTFLGAVPLFTLLPRLGSPYVMGPGGTSGTMVGGAGLMDYVTLDVVGRVRTSRAVAMRVTYETPPPDGHEMRFRAAVYSEFKNSGWARTRRRARALRRERDGFFHVSAGQPRSWAEIWLAPGVSTGLVLPVETVTVNLPASILHLDQLGVVTVPFGHGRTVNYRAGMPAEFSRLRLAALDDEDMSSVESENLSEVSVAIAGLAREVAGVAPPAEQARRIEEHLSRNYQYTLDLVGKQSDSPVDDFLFRNRRGHCEYFASSMVLMLRSLDIPARFTTGYLGGEFSPFENYYVVRQSDAHAWVEAFLPDRGWTTYDPTPPSGRPSSHRSGWSRLMTQAYDYLVFRWDRHVLTYGFFDQVSMTRDLVAWLSDWWSSRRQETESSVEDRVATTDPAEDKEVAQEGDGDLGGLGLIPLLVLVLAGGWWIWRHRPAFSGVRAYRRLRSRVEGDDDVEHPGSLPPLRLAAQIDRLHPPASVPARRVINLYLRESFGGQELTDEERIELRAALRDAIQGLRKTA